ncbi:MAG: TIGR02996 domain-containing protein [Planctomycetes bacterium]|nr:TIGR02996 domain-containing protein [Planctomycetota bacterium]
MNEEEAFIRAIVGNPGDDLPRLVYADWLDDRDDPRGAYLRAECEAVETGDVARLRKLAVGLDPVWVARVSMPPVGVCISGIQFTDHGWRPATANIIEAERKLGIVFAADYKAFLLNYNGGWIDVDVESETPAGESVRYPTGMGWRFHPIERVDRFALRPDDILPTDFVSRLGLPPLTEPIENWVSRFVVIGRDPDLIGTIFLGVSGADRGHVRILDTSVELESGVRYNIGSPPYAASFADFLEHVLGRSLDSPPPLGDDSDTEPIPF